MGGSGLKYGSCKVNDIEQFGSLGLAFANLREVYEGRKPFQVFM